MQFEDKNLIFVKMKPRQSVQYQNIDQGYCGSLSIKPCLG